MKENIQIAGIILLVILVVIFGFKYGKRISYNVFYKDMVNQTIDEEFAKRFADVAKKSFEAQPSCEEFAEAFRKLREFHNKCGINIEDLNDDQ